MRARGFGVMPMLAVGSLLVAACGSSDSGGGNTGPTPDFTVAAGTAAATTLGTQTTFTVDLHSSGYAGPVTLAVTGAPATWTVAIAASPVTLAANGNASATVTVTVPSNGAAAPSGQTLTVHATAGSVAHTSGTRVTVANEFIVPIASGTGTGAHWGTLAGTTVYLNAGTTLTIRNDDSSVHQVHANNTITGFPHQAGDMTTGGAYSNVLASGSDTFYCHDHGQGAGTVKIIVQ